jgi:hypothetical protein
MPVFDLEAAAPLIVTEAPYLEWAVGERTRNAVAVAAILRLYFVT